MSAVPRHTRVVFDHLDRLSDDRGLFEHALLGKPRREHGYCVDDVARGLLVVCREPDRPAPLERLEQVYLAFVEEAIEADGRCRNRCDTAGRWAADSGVGDWWGRALWGLGTAAVLGGDEAVRSRARFAFRRAARRRSADLRAMAWAGLGAVQILRTHPDDTSAASLLGDVVDLLRRGGTSSWPWPEARLRYANAALAEVLIVGGDVFGEDEVTEKGLSMLSFLLSLETRIDHLSLTPVAGRGPAERHALRRTANVDQQPIEAATIADACVSAHEVTGDSHWLVYGRMAWEWFLGSNDGKERMFEPHTGGGYDGLQPSGPNLNQGAESTLAYLSTAQHALRFGWCP